MATRGTLLLKPSPYLPVLMNTIGAAVSVAVLFALKAGGERAAEASSERAAVEGGEAVAGEESGEGAVVEGGQAAAGAERAAAEAVAGKNGAAKGRRYGFWYFVWVVSGATSVVGFGVSFACCFGHKFTEKSWGSLLIIPGLFLGFILALCCHTLARIMKMKEMEDRKIFKYLGILIVGVVHFYLSFAIAHGSAQGFVFMCIAGAVVVLSLRTAVQEAPNMYISVITLLHLVTGMGLLISLFRDAEKKKAVEQRHLDTLEAIGVTAVAVLGTIVGTMPGGDINAYRDCIATVIPSNFSATVHARFGHFLGHLFDHLFGN